MIKIFLENINGLNTSLQVGDAIFATSIGKQNPSTGLDSIINESLDANNPVDVGAQKFVGTLAKIEFQDNQIILTVNTTKIPANYIPKQSDYIMFSKNTQRNGDVAGYYAKAKFVNDSKEKAELFAVSSEVVINSK